MPVIPGSPDPDDLPGTPDDDTLTGLGGNDTLTGLGGNDELYGGDDNDLLDGSGGEDSLFGDGGNDTLMAREALSFNYGGTGEDIIWLGVTVGPGTVAEGYGGADDDYIAVSGPLGALADGGDGVDGLGITTRLAGSAPPDYFVDISTGNGNAFSSDGQDLDFLSIEYLFFNGGDGNDTVIGGGLDDTIFGGRGANRLEGGDGDDIVAIGYGGQQTLDGGAGDTDRLIVIDATFPVYFIVDPDGSVDDGQLSLIEGFEQYEIEGSDLGDIVRTGDGNDLVSGFRGDDTLLGDAGSDLLIGGRQNDELHGGDDADRLQGGGQSDTLYGGEGGDKLFGDNHDDYLFGGAGNDTLVGGLGSDLLWGDGGADTFRFTTVPEGADAEDWIGDFETGVDRIVINRSILAGSPDLGRLTADELSVGALSGTEGQFLLVDLGGSFQSYLFWDPDGTGSTDATLITILNGGPPISGTDIWVA